MGELGIQLGDPDGYALDVLGDILNSFGGRLFDRIRSREVRSVPAVHAAPAHASCTSARLANQGWVSSVHLAASLLMLVSAVYCCFSPR